MAEDLCGDLCLLRAKMNNCTFAGNSAFDSNLASVGLGGGIALTMSGHATVDNCVFWDNTHKGTQDEFEQIYVEPDAMVTVTFSDIMDDNPDDPNIPFGGAANGNIDDNPVFLEDPVQASGDWSSAAVYCAPSCPADPMCNDFDEIGRASGRERV